MEGSERKAVVFTAEEADELCGIIWDWISEGFTTPPYRTRYYDIFDKLAMKVERPPPGSKHWTERVDEAEMKFSNTDST